MPPFVDTFRAMPARSKAIIAVSGVAILAIAFLLLRIAGAPAYTLVSSGLDPAQTGKITAALDEQGIAYELRSNGTALAVEKTQAAQARVALAGEGVSLDSAGGGKGFELFDEQKLGASDFQQQVTYQRALEGEIARTIGNVQGVSGAQVQLVLPEDDLFADEASPATAAVMLTNSADAMEGGAVRGIAQLVASSVKGLKTENVTITDASGQLLWPEGEGGGGGVTSGKQALEARYSRAVEADLTALLVRTLGPGKAQVSVNADLNANKTTREQLKYDRRGVPTETQTETERLRGGATRPGGTAGSGANIPTYSQNNAAGGGDSSYQREDKTVKQAVGKTVDRTEIPPGDVKKLNLALLVDESVPPEVFNSVQEAVAGAAGVDEERGDTMQAAQVPFAKAETPKAGPVPTTLLGPLKWVGIGLASLLFLFFMARHLRKREGEALATPAWLTEIEEPVSLAELEQRTQVLSPAQATITLPPRSPDTNLQALDQLMEREPERVAAHVKQWMSED
jgi:flagellar M-ring protein FliF